MLNVMIPQRRALAATLTLGLFAMATACSPDQQNPLGANPAPADLKVGLEVSNAQAKPGDKVVVALKTDSAAGLQGIQGFVRYDAAALSYVGQPAGGSSLVLVNDGESSHGQLRLIAADAHGISDRPVTLVFQVKQPNYTTGLKFNMEAAVRADKELARAEEARNVDVAQDLLVPSATEKLDARGWMQRLAPADARPELAVMLTPGQYTLNLKYGNVTRDAANAINVLDVVSAANVSVASAALIDSTAKDVVIAGNVRPINGGTGGSPRPGVEPASATAPDGQINVTDVVAIANASVGASVPVVGDLIPGRGAISGNRAIINSDITANRTFFKDTIYQIGDVSQGTIQVRNGATLTIQAGTHIEGHYGTQVYTGGIGSGQGTLIIARDGRINAVGTVLEPITMTCQLPTQAGPLGQPANTRWPGCWGGLILTGNATINSDSPTSGALGPSPVVASRSTGGCIQEADEFSALPYGGCNDTDSSGVVQYVVLSYGGARFTPTKERNGITFNGVGSATVIDHIQSHASLDDASEYFGGTVNVKYMYLTGAEDDNFDWVLGYRGKAQFILVQADSTNADRCMEMDNNGVDGGNADALPRSNPTIYNVTCVGKKDPVRYTAVAGLPVTCATQLSSAAVPTQNCVNQAFLFRQNTAGIVKNAIAYRYAAGLDVDGFTAGNGGSAFGICSNLPLLQNSIISLRTAAVPAGATGTVSQAGDPDGSDPNNGGVCGAYTLNAGRDNLEALMIADPLNSITVFNDGDAAGDFLIDPFNVIAPDFRPKAGSAPTNAALVAAVPADPFFTSVSYIGAVAPAAGAGSNIPWYSGWTVGYVSASGGPFAGWPQK